MSLLNDLQNALGGNQLDSLAKNIGGDTQATQTAMGAALPLLLGALGRNAQNPEGAQALAGALERDHDGSILDNLDGFIGNPDSADGAGILRHVLGAKQSRVETSVGKAAGLDSAQVGKLLATLAPVVLGAMGRKQRQEKLDAGGLTNMLSGETGNLGSAGLGGGLLNSLLDSDKDGDVDLSDLARGAGKLFGR